LLVSISNKHMTSNHVDYIIYITANSPYNDED